MKLKKKEFEIFNLSFLDVISCGFGAVVLLVLISHTEPDTSKSSVDEAQGLLNQVIALETKIDTLAEEIDHQQKQNDDQLSESGSLGGAAQTLAQRLGLVFGERVFKAYLDYARNHKDHTRYRGRWYSGR
jgi:hypothetical protein